MHPAGVCQIAGLRNSMPGLPYCRSLRGAAARSNLNCTQDHRRVQGDPTIGLLRSHGPCGLGTGWRRARRRPFGDARPARQAPVPRRDDRARPARLQRAARTACRPGRRVGSWGAPTWRGPFPVWGSRPRPDAAFQEKSQATLDGGYDIGRTALHRQGRQPPQRPRRAPRARQLVVVPAAPACLGRIANDPVDQPRRARVILEPAGERITQEIAPEADPAVARPCARPPRCRPA